MNAQTKALKKNGFCTRNLGDVGKDENSNQFDQRLVKEIQHGKKAFMPPDTAKRYLKDNEVRSWKTFQKHPAHVAVGER